MAGKKAKRAKANNLETPREVPVDNDAKIEEVTPGPDVELAANVKNPMEEPVVLATFFKVCDLADLRRFRLVSSQWYELSLTRWREEMTLGIAVDDNDMYPEEDPEVSFLDCKKLEWKHVSELYDKSEWKKLQSKPYRRYSLGNVSFAKSSIISCRTRSSSRYFRETWSSEFANMDEFWKRCGPSMRYLKLYLSKVFCVGSLREVISELTPCLEELAIFALELDEGVLFRKEDEISRSSDGIKEQKNLKSLQISLLGGCFIPIQWEGFFQLFPNIERLMLRGFLEVGDEEVLALAAGLERLERKPLIKSLDIGQLACEDPEITIQLLQSMNLKLEELSIPVKSRLSSPSMIPPALEGHRDTLKTLTLHKCFWIANSGLQLCSTPFPALIFTSLTKLMLFSGACQNLQFLLQTPNLTVLHVDVYKTLDSMIRIPDASLFEDFVLSRLVELHFNDVGYGYVLPASKVDILVKLMPNVMRLMAPLKTASLRAVCQNWKNLRWLDIANDKLKLDDNAITGLIPGQDIRKPNLTDLKYLHELSIDKGESLTDKSIYGAFFKLPYLHTLNVTMSAKTTDEAFDDLLKRFPQSRLRRYSPSRERRSITEN